MNANIAVIGMGVMGSCLALNMANHKFKVSVYNYTPDLTDKFIKNHPHENITAYYDIPSLVQSVARPRKFFIMVTAGKAVDAVIDSLLPYLEADDIIMDGGNSFYKDTQRRYKYVTEKGFKYFGVGVSGGEEGALNGPALMPGGNKESYPQVQSVLEAIAAKADDGKPCCTYIGEDGAGHYVKMVHNGIEYADMQLIAEAYLLLKKCRRTYKRTDFRRIQRLEQRRTQQLFNQHNSRYPERKRRYKRRISRRQNPRQRRTKGHRPLDEHRRTRTRRKHFHHDKRLQCAQHQFILC